ncbi:hypothetical protein PHMEG_00014912 [Phytophthora megakarya]|uniref:Peptidase A2 domain-containing protein n=1 Tax=Phytophthora megakarya TaxID=4795 RepID=A0A225W465_9STRA|nr:hypothetical protein PHMEG_00014912 [Phytophthora megakarya]
MNVEMLLTGHSREVTSVHKAMNNSQVDFAKLDSDLQLNLDRGSTITAADAVSRDQVMVAACGGQNHSTHYCFRRCRLCQQVHDFGKCEAFDELAKILRTNVDKKNIGPELQKLVFDCPPTETGLVPTGQPQSADLVIDAERLYAFTGKCEWPEDNNNNNNEKEKNVEYYYKNVVNDDWLVSICEASEAAPMHAKTVKLLPGERMGWWSSQRFNRRLRMRALVRGTVNDVRTSILLDTGANVSIITTKLARRLRLDPIQEHGRQLEVQRIQEGKLSTTTRVKAKVILGWNTVYEFEFWVMDVLDQKWYSIYDTSWNSLGSVQRDSQASRGRNWCR